MKAERGDFKKGYGEIRLYPEVADDLWHLEHLIRPGDLVFATTLRTVEIPQDKLRPEKAEKRPVRLGIRVEKVSFHPHTGKLRILGLIEQGTEISAHHTLMIEPGEEISVIKFWSPLDLERIERAERSTMFGAIHILTIEEGEAELYRMRQYGPELVLAVTRGSGKGAGVDGKRALFETVIGHLTTLIGHLVIAGPGFIKDDFMKFLRQQSEDLATRAVLIETRGSGRSAVQEVIGQGVLERMVGDLQLQHEVRLMEEFLTRIAKGEPVAYGRAEVEEAVSCGAVDRILVADTLLRDRSLIPILEAAEQIRAKVSVLSTAFEPGEQLASLGGIAALLRYRIR